MLGKFPVSDTCIRMAAKKANREGRVNVALGKREKELESQATLAGVTKTSLARILIIDGLEKLASGTAIVRGPSLEVAQS